MRIAPYLATLLTLAPVYGYRCTQAFYTYVYACDDSKLACTVGNVNPIPGNAQKELDTWVTAWKAWANDPGTNGDCGGSCSAYIPVSVKYYTGLTWGTNCTMARRYKKTLTGVPGVPSTIKVIADETDCDVHCNIGGSKTCSFVYGKCK
ncbi:hypothetical protein FKW77_006846 [Venturia effusa]|uniref:Secreted protein n=1 Tax=Venturia effusa TaxID=50376 RepID=A0A517L3J5_9PEZI|nr:hypothetical protein FKW77_006846 [Venturia effusa]